MKKALKILVAVLLIFVGISTALFFYFQKNIQPILVAEINKSLAVRVSVDDITVSRIQDFPKIGVRLSNISVEESIPFYKDKLIQANELNLYVNLVKLYQGKYVIDEVSIRGGTINIVDLDNSNNYDIIKSSDDKKSTNISFEIDQLKLLNCYIKYNHTPSQTKINGFTSSSNIGIKYNNSSTFLKIKSNLKNLNLLVNKDGYVNDKNVSLNTKIIVNTTLKTISIEPSSLNIENINLSTHGKINYDESSLVDIKFENERTDTKELIRVLPTNLKKSFDNFNLEGDLAIDGFINGHLNKNGKLSIGIDYMLTNGNLMLKENKIGINQLNAKGTLSMPDIENIRNSKFNCNLTSANNGSNQLKGDIEVTDFEKLKIKWQGEAQLDPVFINKFMANPNFIPSNGIIKFDGNLSFIYDISLSKIVHNTLDYNGSIAIKNIQGKVLNPRLTIHQLNTEIQSKDNSIIVQNAQIKYNQTQAILNGYIKNVASILNDNSQAKFIGNLEIDNLNINELISEDTNSKTKNNNIELSPIQFEIATKVNSFKVNEFKAKSINGTLISDKKSIRLEELKMTALDGTIDGEISIKN
ncbi:MAG: hypothetical protein P8P81_04150, partial [Bacteroidia bacterium]|nr:hypothetical protein [Bacteroidia bacterium]